VTRRSLPFLSASGVFEHSRDYEQAAGAFAMTILSQDQLAGYLACVSFDPPTHGDAPSLAALSSLVKLHVATFPFESLSLHYSQTRRLSLKVDDIYAKMINTGRGGYCMEQNALFGAVLRTLGYRLYSTGGRVSFATAGLPGDKFLGWNHMVNIVTVNKERYLVDVGFGRTNPCRPVPLSDSAETTGIGEQRLRVYQRTLAQHSDDSQKSWVYSHKENEAGDWTDGYAFTEIEFFPEDFEVMNLNTMTNPSSFFVQCVMCVKVILGEAGEPVGLLILFNGELKRQIGAGEEILETFKTEGERLAGLKKWFGISLDAEQKRGIVGLPSELTG
jgi:arylamine N-acetyltransferase